MTNEIDYDALKKRAFLREKQNGLVTLRTRAAGGNYTTGQLKALAEISQKYGKGIAHATTRQGLEIPFIRVEDVNKVEKEIQSAGIGIGASGATMRTITTCPGNNWCKRGLINTFDLAEKIEKKLNIHCGMSMPHKFKIAISGCPNACTRAEASEIGIHGQVNLITKQIGYTVYVGGCGGKTPHYGIKLDRIFTEEEALKIIEQVVAFFKENAKPKQRLALLIKDIGQQEFLKKIYG